MIHNSFNPDSWKEFLSEAKKKQPLDEMPRPDGRTHPSQMSPSPHREADPRAEAFQQALDIIGDLTYDSLEDGVEALAVDAVRSLTQALEALDYKRNKVGNLDSAGNLAEKSIGGKEQYYLQQQNRAKGAAMALLDASKEFAQMPSHEPASSVSSFVGQQANIIVDAMVALERFITSDPEPGGEVGNMRDPEGAPMRERYENLSKEQVDRVIKHIKENKLSEWRVSPEQAETEKAMESHLIEKGIYQGMSNGRIDVMSGIVGEAGDALAASGQFDDAAIGTFVDRLNRMVR